MGMNLKMTKGNNETYIFIIWEKARNKSDEIIDDLNKKFIIRNVIEITWDKHEFLNNLKRFYGKSLPDANKKAEVCGTGPFLLIVVTDINLKFNEPSKSNISSERDYVNVNIFNSKEKYRKLIGKRFTVHSSISQNETEHNLTLLFGKNTSDFTKDLPDTWDGTIKKLTSNLIGTNGWKTMAELLYVMNGTVNYVILRNFEEMPSKFDYHDVDLLVDDEKLAYIVKKDFSKINNNSRSIKIKIGNQDITLNPNYLGDHYYDQKWEKDILKRRVLHDNGFYIPNKSDYFYTLLYHVIFHNRWKKIISIRDDYKKLLLDLAKEIKLEEVTEISLNNKNLSKIIIKKYMKESYYKETDTISYRIRYNESSRLFKTSLFILKTHGIKHLSYAIKEKIKLILKLR
jgi:predicted component of type VI protein secretion system|tara:strand:+ start:27 stop:1226 length:1200 start_codon:yes stop_codon:yes gene_type:complete